MRACAPRRRRAGWGWRRAARSGCWAGRHSTRIPAALPFLGLGETHYRPPHGVGPLPRSAAGMLRATWGLLGPEIARRRENAERLRLALSRVDGVRLVTPPAGAEPSWLRLPVLVEAERRDAIARELRALGVVAGYPKSLAELEQWSEMILNRNVAFPGAHELAASLVTLPVHSHAGTGDMRRLESLLPGLGARG